ncbi:MAG: aspartate kinase [Candidatus Omnitrophica bacterium]|nr:aspartate kinase [Candidatus Omnitrophota bacterium]
MILVQKYGGSSVANIKKVKNVARRVVAAKRKGNQVVVVVSAPGDTTDELIDLAGKISKLPNRREMDMLLSTGEQMSVALLAMAIHELGEDAVSMTGYQVGIITDEVHGAAKIEDIDARRMKAELAKGKIVIVAGFQGKTANHEITTLGRGGSDLTAVALASVLKAKVCEIYTDVDGVYNADPRIVSNARKLPVISYDEMMEMASLGAKVMQSRSVEVGKKYDVPILVRNSMNNAEGTLITKENKKMEKVLVSGITLNEDEAKVTILKVPDKPGIAAKVFSKIAEGNINIDMIIQNKSTTNYTDISFTVFRSDLKRALPVIRKAAEAVKARGIQVDDNIAKVSLVGVGMKSHSGVAGKMFSALAEKGINIEMISTSEIKISCVVDGRRGKEAVRAIHKKFELGKKK